MSSNVLDFNNTTCEMLYNRPITRLIFGDTYERLLEYREIVEGSNHPKKQIVLDVILAALDFRVQIQERSLQ